MTLPHSQQVDWWSVHLFVAEFVAELDWPMAGTPAWCDLEAGDPRKLAAVLDAGQHHALRVETAQIAQCDASRAIAAAADWRAIAQRIRSEAEFYARRPWLKRATA